MHKFIQHYLHLANVTIDIKNDKTHNLHTLYSVKDHLQFIFPYHNWETSIIDFGRSILIIKSDVNYYENI